MIIEMMMTMMLMTIMFMRHDGYYNVSLPVLLSKRDLVKMITKDSTKLS